jgi:hypothetical protein
MNWSLTLTLIAVILFIGLFQAIILKQGLGFSRDILEGSGELMMDIRNHLSQFSTAPRYNPEQATAIDESLEVKGARRFLSGYKNRLILTYKSQLLAQMSFALALSIALTVFLHYFRNGEITSQAILRYCVFLLPTFGALIGLLNAVVGITTSRPYFEIYLSLFDTRKKQARFHISTRGAAVPPSDKQQEGFSLPKLGWHTVLAPIDQSEWPEFLRLQEGLHASGIMPAQIPLDRLMMVPALWPPRIASIESFLGLKKPLDLEELGKRFPQLDRYIAEISVAVQRLREEQAEEFDGLLDSDALTPREKTLFFLLASLQEGSVLVMNMRVFCSISERDRFYLVNEVPDASVLCIIPRVPKVNYKPSLSRAVAIFGNGTWQELDAEHLDDIDPATQKRLESEHITIVLQATDPDLLN